MKEGAAKVVLCFAGCAVILGGLYVARQQAYIAAVPLKVIDQRVEESFPGAIAVRAALVNRSNRPVEVVEIKPRCSCVKCDMLPLRIMPEESEQLTLTLESPPMPEGYFLVEALLFEAEATGPIAKIELLVDESDISEHIRN
ncbi:MAG: hypothetical protein AAF662_03885 [Pseudomonadota bacterium]